MKDFLEYQKKSNNYYQLKKLIEFLDELQTSNNSGGSFNERGWVGRVWIAEELFRYTHPFILPNLITIQVFSSVNIAKTF